MVIEFRQALRERVLLLDGSMGALLQKRGLPAGMAPDVWMLDHKDLIRQVHAEYVDAGSDILIANTFGGSRWRLDEYDAYRDIEKINAMAVDLARQAAKDRAYVAGNIGPSGETVFPTGHKTFDEVFEVFREQAKILVECGVDLFVIETMFDSIEYRAALSAVRDVSMSIPIIAHATFNTDGLTDTGASASNIVAIAEGYHADVVGINCSTGPETMGKIVDSMLEMASIYVSVQPNAGLPLMRDGQTVFPLTPDEMAPYLKQFMEKGIRVVGGCCGTTPEYIRMLASLRRDNKSEYAPQKPQRVLFSSLGNAVKLGGNEPFLPIGEKMNPSGRKKLSASLKKGELETLLADAKLQVDSGGRALDLNVGVPLVDEVDLLKRAVVAVQNQYPEIPLMLDSSNSFALEAGASVYYGRPLLNSINAEEEKIEEMLPIIKKHGAAVVCLLTGVEVPERAQDRMINAEKSYKYLVEECGLAEQDIVFDCLGLVVSAMQQGSIETLRTIQLIKERFPNSATTLGLSNTSFGLPNRKFVHGAFLVGAIQHGLDSAIMSVVDPINRILADSAGMWGPKTGAVHHYIESWSTPLKFESGAKLADKQKPKQEDTNDKSAPPSWVLELPTAHQNIFFGIIDGKKDLVQAEVQEFVTHSSDQSMELFINVMTPAIRHLGDLFALRIKFIPHLIAAADAMKAGVGILEPFLLEARKASGESRGTIVFATVKGDIHDIGKNICVLMLKNFGYNVIDLGRNVEAEEIITKGVEHQASILALSALMTTTMIQMKVVIDAVRERDLPFKVMIGGAVVTPEFAREIQADGYSTDVGTVVSETERVITLLDLIK